MASRDPRTVVKTKECILSYPHLFVAQAGPDGGEPKFSCTLIMEEDYPAEAMAELKQAVSIAAQEFFGDKAGALYQAGKLRIPFHHDAWEEKGYPENSVYFSCSSKRTQPGMVHRYAGPDGKSVPITDPADLYPGCRVWAQIRAYGYDVSGNKGVAFAIDNLQKLGEGERLDGRQSAQQVFEPLDTEPTPMPTTETAPPAGNLFGGGAPMAPAGQPVQQQSGMFQAPPQPQTPTPVNPGLADLLK